MKPRVCDFVAALTRTLFEQMWPSVSFKLDTNVSIFREISKSCHDATQHKIKLLKHDFKKKTNKKIEQNWEQTWYLFNILPERVQ